MRTLSKEAARDLVLSAIFLEDLLSEIFYVKGGAALAIHKATNRFSEDIDISIEIGTNLSDFEIEERIKNALTRHLSESGYELYNFKFAPRPKRPEAGREDWGGYEIEFIFLPKGTDIAERERFAYFANMADGLHSIKIDLSKNEFCDWKEIQLNESTVKIYTLEAIVAEKLRAICQQSENYTETKSKRSRAQDIIDIYNIGKAHNLHKKFTEKSLLELLIKIFDVKKVPLSILLEIPNMGDLLKQSFQAKYEALPSNERHNMTLVQFFDVSHRYVCNLAQEIFNALGK
jgi:predicted nucleotidyltransferase component of viral defense system